MSSALSQTVTDPASVTADVVERLTPLVDDIVSADYRTAWRILVTCPPVAEVVADSLAGVRGDGRLVRAVAVIEGIGRAGVPAGLCYAFTSQVFGIQWPLGGVEPQPLAPYADRIMDGTLLLCHALTEETGGSDPLSMRTAATPLADGGWQIDGRKAYVTAAPEADVTLMFARTDTARHPFALSAFLVPTDLPAVTRSEPFEKVALPEVPMGAIDFDGVTVPDSALVASEGSGLAFLATTTAWERALLMSYAVGGMARTLERVTEWLTTREQFGRKLGSSPLVASRVADLAIAAHRVRTLVHDMARRMDDEHVSISSVAADAAMVKISCAQDLLDFETTVGPLFGARAVVADSGVAINAASAVAASIYAGTNDLLRIGIARGLGLPVEN